LDGPAQAQVLGARLFLHVLGPSAQVVQYGARGIDLGADGVQELESFFLAHLLDAPDDLARLSFGLQLRVQGSIQEQGEAAHVCLERARLGHGGHLEQGFGKALAAQGDGTLLA